MISAILRFACVRKRVEFMFAQHMDLNNKVLLFYFGPLYCFCIWDVTCINLDLHIYPKNKKLFMNRALFGPFFV